MRDLRAPGFGRAARSLRRQRAGGPLPGLRRGGVETRAECLVGHGSSRGGGGHGKRVVHFEPVSRHGDREGLRPLIGGRDRADRSPGSVRAGVSSTIVVSAKTSEGRAVDTRPARQRRGHRQVGNGICLPGRHARVRIPLAALFIAEVAQWWCIRLSGGGRTRVRLPSSAPAGEVNGTRLTHEGRLDNTSPMFGQRNPSRPRQARVRVYQINLATQDNTTQFAPDQPVVQLAGFSESLFRFIAAMEVGDSIVDRILADY